MVQAPDPLAEDLVRLLVPSSKEELDEEIELCKKLQKSFADDPDFIEPQLWPLRIKQIWDDSRTHNAMAEALGFCELKLMWRTFLQPKLSDEQHLAKYRDDACRMLSSRLKHIFSEPHKRHVDSVCDSFVSSFDITHVRETIQLLNTCRQCFESADDLIEAALRNLKSFESSGYGQVDHKIALTLRLMITGADRLRSKIIAVDPEIIVSLRDLSFEYIQWLRNHPNALGVMAYDAFEKLMAEIFAEHGFQVDITASLRNRHADIIAVRSGTFEPETKYLIECKRYHPSRPVGMEIVCQVLGALQLVKADYAFLVTTSSFTRDVKRKAAELRDLHLHLRDGAQIRKWLQDYKFRSDKGLWLEENWDGG